MARGAGAVATGLEAGVGAVRGVQAVQFFANEQYTEGAGAAGEALLRLFGVSLKALRSARRVNNGASASTAEEAIDFSSAAKGIPGKTWRNLDQLRSYLDRNGIGLQEKGGWWLDRHGKGKMAGFDWSRDRPVIFLRPGATKTDVLHEIGHALVFRRLGKDGYQSLPHKIREHLAAKFATGRPSFTRNMTFEQILNELRRVEDNFNPSVELVQKLRGLGIFE